MKHCEENSVSYFKQCQAHLINSHTTPIIIIDNIIMSNIIKPMLERKSNYKILSAINFHFLF